MLAFVLAALLAGPSAPTIAAPHVATTSPVKIRLGSHEQGVSAARIRFRCSVDSNQLHACARAVSLNLADGVHVFRAQAVDPAGRKSRLVRFHIDVKLTAPIPRAESFPVGDHPVYLAAGGGAIWVANFGDASIARVDPANGSVSARIPVGGIVSGVSYGDGSVWVGNFQTNLLTRIDPTTNAVVARIALGTHPFGTAFTPDGDAWVSNDDGSVARLDPATNTVRATIRVGGQAEITAYGFGLVWSTNQDGSVTAIDPATDSVAGRIVVSRDVDDISVASDSVYVGTFYNGVIARIDPATRAIAAQTTLPSGIQAGGVLSAAGFVWATGYNSNLLYKLDPQTLKRVGSVRLGTQPRQSVFAGGAVWTVNELSGSLTKWAP